MGERPATHERTAYFVGITCWAAHLVLIWIFPLVPSVDYPEWLYQASILARYAQPEYDYSRWYAIVFSPVPNGGFVLPVSLLAGLFPVESAGKIMLTVYVLWFPLSIRSFLRAVEAPPFLWLAAVPLLFNLAFVAGNFAFLIGMCLLFTMIGKVERAKAGGAAISPGLHLLLTVAVFLAHALPAAIYMVYLAFCLATRKGAGRQRMVFAAGIVTLLLLATAYYFTRPSDPSILRMEWGVNLHFRVGVFVKHFTAGLLFPPFEFSAVRWGATITHMGFAAVLAGSGLRGLYRSRNHSLAGMALALVGTAAIAPKLVLGIGEVSGRLVLVAFLLLLAFTPGVGRWRTLLTTALASITLLVTAVRLSDYAVSHQKLTRRLEFLQQHIRRNAAVLTLEDGSGRESVPFWHLTPRSLHYVFQTDYVLLDGGLNATSFRTGFLTPRPGYDAVWELLLQRALRKDTSPLRGSEIPPWVEYLVMDFFSGRGEEAARTMEPFFKHAGTKEIAPGFRTVLLRRAE
jgi:hypothetical protein